MFYFRWVASFGVKWSTVLDFKTTLKINLQNMYKNIYIKFKVIRFNIKLIITAYTKIDLIYYFSYNKNYKSCNHYVNQKIK